MTNKKLTCPSCNSILRLEIAYDGCDWDTEAGEGSGYKFPISLTCTDPRCASIYTLGRLKDYCCFSKVKDDHPYEWLRINE